MPSNQNRIDWFTAVAAAVASCCLVGINQSPKGYLVFHVQSFFFCVCALLLLYCYLVFHVLCVCLTTYLTHPPDYFYPEILVGIPHRPRTLFSHAASKRGRIGMGDGRGGEFFCGTLLSVIGVEWGPGYGEVGWDGCMYQYRASIAVHSVRRRVHQYSIGCVLCMYHYSAIVAVPV